MPKIGQKAQQGPTKRMQEYLQGFVPCPEGWLKKTSEGDSKGAQLYPLKCTEWDVLIHSWKKAMRWTFGLDCGLVMMLGSVMSTTLLGEQLWVKIIGPPSCGKTTLLEGVAVARKYTLSKDTIRGFYSGMDTKDKDGNSKDSSIASMARDKTLLTKDGDSLLKSPTLVQTLSEARGLYDGAGRTHYRNGVMNDYVGHRMTWVLCGTSSLREIDDSELGARFIDCVIMDEIEDEFEDEVAWRAANSEASGMRQESNKSASSQYPKDLATAMRLTGGYAEYLRENASILISDLEVSDESLRVCAKLGKFVAYMRARPSKVSDEEEREFSPRLVKQIVRTMQAIAVTTGNNTMNEDVMARVVKVALDTSRGISLEVVRSLKNKFKNGLDVRSIALLINKSEDQVRRHVKFLVTIGVLDLKISKHTRQRRFKPTRSIKKLWEEIERWT